MSGIGAGAAEAAGEEAPEPEVRLPDRANLMEEVAAGLGGRPPSLPCRLFYDERGARLFERITELEEYYPTRTEIGVLRSCAGEAARFVGPGARVVEYGSGSGDKTWILLEHLEDPVAYVPVDVARGQLAGFAARVNRRFPELEVLPLAADYRELDALPAPRREPRATVAFFPGSTVGNLEPEEAVGFLARIARLAGPGSYLLIGVDLVKERRILERAYNDGRGVTAAFNRNILHHVNHLLEGDFQPEAFRHRATWNPEASRIEMRLVAERAQEVTLRSEADGPAHRFRFPAGRAIVTEHCYKYTLEGFRELSGRAGYAPVEAWTDPEELFSVHLLRVDEEG